MDKFHLIILVVIGLLIFRQFIPKEVNRFDFIGLPILALYKTYTSLPNTLSAPIMVELIILLLLGATIGYIQARKTRVVYQDNKLHTIGGISYIIGLLILIIGRLIVIFIFHSSTIITALKNGGESLVVELANILTGSGDWILWSTIAASTILYSITLYKNHPKIRKYIREQLKS
ncbi:hypothetical protein [Paucisalibacillus globulus]|uniref:hypothetical protein n=1 Tax=Paucisalibacillus globulus TaxID=351095 RepID=UPI000BB881BD|nr:hypothetical protein [Paucisalibacillus globulus]